MCQSLTQYGLIEGVKRSTYPAKPNPHNGVIILSDQLGTQLQSRNEEPRGQQGSQQPTKWLTTEEQALWRTWLFVASRIDATMARDLLRESDLSLSDYAVLVPLSEHEEHKERIAALADHLQWDRSRLSHQITRMSKRGLVRRETCAEDGRGAFVAIEPAGMEAIAAAAPSHVTSVRRSFTDRLDSNDRADLARILKKLASQFQD